MFRRPFAFLKRDFLMAISYRLSFAMQIVGMLISVFVFFFVSRLFGDAARPMLKEYGGNYFSFVLVGIAFTGYLGVGLSSFSQSISREQSLGTLEAMLVTPTGIATMVLSMSLWSFVLTSLNVVLYLLIASLLFGVDLRHINVPCALVGQALTILCFASLGIISASFIMVLKRGDPINWIFGGISTLVGGVYYPVQVLPKPLMAVSYLLPITYALRAIRLSVLRGYGFHALRFELGMLVAFTALYLPLSILAFRYAVKRAKIEGSLTHY